MTTDQTHDEQLALMTSLLEGAEPDAYVVLPVADLVRVFERALFLTKDTGGRYRVGRASVRLIQLLQAGGHVVNTKYEQPT